MQLKDLPVQFPGFFWEREDRIYCHRYDGGQSLGANHGNPIEVEVTELGGIQTVQFRNGELDTNLFQKRVQVFSRTGLDILDGVWPGGWFDVFLEVPATPNNEPYREW